MRPRVFNSVTILIATVVVATALPLGIVLASHTFNDVPSTNQFHNDISAIAAAGVTSGCGGGNYCPKDNVTREQMAAFMNRLGALGPGQTPVVNADQLDGLDAGAFAAEAHHHDGRYYRKNQTNDLVFDHRSIVGSISGATGDKRDNGPYTSSRSATGVYLATYQTTGLGIETSQMPPNVTVAASWLCPAGSTAQADWNSFVSLGDAVTSFSIQVRTFNSAGAAADCSTQFQLEFAPASSLVIPAAADGALFPTAFPRDATVECRNEPDSVVCEPVD